MCPACGSIDLNLLDVERPAPAAWVARERATGEDWRTPHKTTVS